MRAIPLQSSTENISKLLACNLACAACPHTHSLDDNSIGDEGAKELAAALRTNTSLTELR
jgi:hypothetical protein